MGAALLLLVNVVALVYVDQARRLAAFEGFGSAAAARVVWLMTLAPPAYVLVMGYTEAVYGLLTVLYLGGLRRSRWVLAVGAGLLAGACRPVAFLLAFAAVVELARRPREAGLVGVVQRAAAVLAPLLGTVGYLAWTGARTGSWLLPYRVQAGAHLRGALVADPLPVALHLVKKTLDKTDLLAGLHVAWLVVFLALLVPMARRLPASYTVFAALSLASAATSGGMQSIERYGWGAFPFVLTLAALTRCRPAYLAALTLSVVGLCGYALLSFAHRFVP